MGTVHGVYLKYVGLSALSYIGYATLMRNTDDVSGSHAARRLIVDAFSSATSRGVGGGGSLVRSITALTLGYSCLLNGVIAILFKLEKGMGLIGKDKVTGQIPLWSKILYFPFHLPTMLYTHVHIKAHPDIPVASEVQPGWWVGSCYGHELKKEWAGVIDLTVEFPESTINTTREYLSLPTWDGVPATPAQLELAANFAVQAHQQGYNVSTGTGGDILVHCAHGRGRSTTVMCACLVKAGLYKTWEEAFEVGIKPNRPVCKLNRRMKQALTEWQDIYVNPPGKKGQ